MSLIAALSIGRSALQAQQRGLEVVGHNIANVNTEGYTRQRLDMISARPITLSGGIILGAGVDVRIIRATLDRYLDERIRLADSTLEDLRARRETLARIEAIVGELSETDLSSAFNRFFNAVEDLTNNPEDLSTRVTLVQVAEGLISEVQTVYSQLQRFREERVSAVEVAVGEINRLVENISELNTSIAARESEPSPQLANDLRDQRSALLTELSRLVYVRSYEDEQGMLNVYSGSYALVQGETYNTFEYSTEVVDGVVYPVITSERDGRELEVTGGRLLGFTEGGEAVIGELVSDLEKLISCLLYTSPSPRDQRGSRMPSSA